MSEPLVILTEADQIDDAIVAAIEDCLDWFEGEPLRTQEFIDRLCQSYADGWDIESYDNAATRLIMRIARSMRAERNL